MISQEKNKNEFEILMHEYDKLREEIVHHSNRIHRINEILGGLIAASLGVTIAKLDVFITIAPFILILAVTLSLESSYILFITAKHLEKIEKKIKDLFGKPILTWESQTCKNIFSKQFALYNPLFLANLIFSIILTGVFSICVYKGYKYLNSTSCVLVANLYILSILILFGIVSFYIISFSFFLKPGGKIEKIISGILISKN